MEKITICLLNSISTAGLDNQQLLYCKQISGESDSELHSPLSLNSEFDVDFNQMAYDQTCQYLHDNKAMFDKIKKDFGYDIWLFHNERFKRRQLNFNVKKAFLESCISKFKNSKIRLLVDNVFELEYFNSMLSESGECELHQQKNRSSILNKLGLLIHFKLNTFKFILYKLFTSASNKPPYDSSLIIHTKYSYLPNSNRIWGNMLPQFSRLFLSVPPSFNIKKEDLILSMKEMRKMQLMNFSDFILFKGLVNPFVLLKIRKKCKLVRSHYPLQNVNVLDHELKAAHASLKVIYLYKLCFDRFFKKSKFKSLLLTDENSPVPRAIRWAAEDNELSTFGYQHGVHSRTKPSYFFKGQNIDDLRLCTKTFVWSRYDYNEYRLAMYPEDKIIISGQIVANQQSELQNKTNLKFAFLYCTQPFIEVSRRKLYFNEVVKSFNRLPNKKNEKLLIRLHPAEMNDKAKYLSGFSEKDLINIEFDEGNQLSESFQQTKSLITAFSTVSKEFSIYNKKVLALDYFNLDLIGIIRDGLAIKITSQDDLILAMKEILDGNFVANHDEYSKMNFHKNENITDFILKHIDDGNN